MSTTLTEIADRLDLIDSAETIEQLRRLATVAADLREQMAAFATIARNTKEAVQRDAAAARASHALAVADVAEMEQIARQLAADLGAPVVAAVPPVNPTATGTSRNGASFLKVDAEGEHHLYREGRLQTPGQTAPPTPASPVENVVQEITQAVESRGDRLLADAIAVEAEQEAADVPSQRHDSRQAHELAIIQSAFGRAAAIPSAPAAVPPAPSTNGKTRRRRTGPKKA